MSEQAARRFATSEVLPAVGSRRAAAMVVVVLAGLHALLLVLAALPLAWPTAVVLAALALVEFAGARREPVIPWALRYVGLTGIGRGLLRGVGVVLLAARTASSGVTIAAAVAVSLIAAATTTLSATGVVAEYLLREPVRSRGLPVPAPRPFRYRSLRRPDVPAAVLDVLAAAAIAAASATGDAAAIVVLGVLAAAPLAATALAAAATLRLRSAGLRERTLDATVQAVAALDPHVLVYLGGTVEWTYQLEVWLRPLERVRQRVLLVVRDPAVLEELPPTSLPVVAVPSANVLMGLSLPSVRAALYVGNSADNVHLLRRPELTSVFLGHGESEKTASVNPVIRAYREVWVAGPAGRDRLEKAGLGIAPETVVEVGRPNLPDLTRRPDDVPRLTVLYAPTWEGFDERDCDSSLAYVGPELIGRLLEHRDVRIMYRPHRNAGLRDGAVRDAHRRIVRLLREAGASPPGRADDPDRYWSDRPGHRVVMAPGPDIYATMQMTDVLIGDISSVTTDFLATDRPYAVVNVRGEPEVAFRARFASAAGGFVLDRELAALDDLLAAGRGGPDPHAAARRAAAEYLLGPRTADPVAGFAAHLDRICADPPSRAPVPLRAGG